VLEDHGPGLDLAARRVTRAGLELEIAALEFKLLACLAQHQGQVVTRDACGPSGASPARRARSTCTSPGCAPSSSRIALTRATSTPSAARASASRADARRPRGSRRSLQRRAHAAGARQLSSFKLPATQSWAPSAIRAEPPEADE
jgi:hypothetical protein